MSKSKAKNLFVKRKNKSMVKKKKPFERIYRLPYPQKRFVKLVYTYYDNVSTSSGATNSQIFNLNSLFDPDRSGVGNQPRYLDELLNSTLYTKYRVDKAHYKVDFINKSATDALISCQVRPNSTLVPPTTSAQLWYSKELASTTVRTILPLGDDKSRQTISGKVNMHSVLGQTKSAYEGTTTNTAAYNANPSTNVVLNVVTSDNPQDDTSSDIDIYVTITYFACVSHLANQVGQS